MYVVEADDVAAVADDVADKAVAAAVVADDGDVA